MPTIVHFEIPADDVERSKKFYNELFGWKIEKWPGPVSHEMDYWMVSTTDEEGNKALGGAIMPRQGPQQPIINYISVKSIDEYSSKVEKLGGKVHVPKTAVSGMGYLAVYLDTENNAFGLWEHNESVKWINTKMKLQIQYHPIPTILLIILCNYVISCPLQHESPRLNYLAGSRLYIVDESPAISGRYLFTYSLECL